MTIGILQCGEVPKALDATFGTYPDMIARLVGGRREVTLYRALYGELPPTPTACDAYILTGSPSGVYESDPWIGDLLGFLRRARGKAKLVGICFGHQAMAQAFGGNVVKSPKGWGVGVHRYRVVNRAPWMDAETTQVAEGDNRTEYVDIAASHQDQVVLCPPSARVFLASDFTPYAGLDYGDAISVQPHPEFDNDFGKALVGCLRDRFGPLTDPAIATFDKPTDRLTVGTWIDRFLDDATVATVGRSRAPAQVSSVASSSVVSLA